MDPSSAPPDQVNVVAIRAGRMIDGILLFSIAVATMASIGAFAALGWEVWIIRLGP